MGNKIIVGMAVNPEIYFSYNMQDGQQKHKLIDFEINLSGTSGNIATALASLGHRSTLFGLIGFNGTPEDLLIKNFNPKDFDFLKLEVLDNSSLSLIPDDSVNESVVVGRRGSVLESKFQETLDFVKNLPESSYKILTGTLPHEVDLGINFLGHGGCKIFTPNRSLCQSGLLKDVLPFVDILIQNLDEHYDLMKNLNLTEISQIHNYGPTGPYLYIVTDEERGGIFSFKGQTSRFDAFHFPGKKFPTGAGDWFLSSLVSKFLAFEESPNYLNFEEIQESINFASKIAGIKVTFAGATKGPNKQEILGYLSIR